MARRTSIYIEGFGHKNPIPAACRIGNMVYSGSIQGTDPATGKPGETLEALISRADAALRRAKESGRDRVEAAA